ncbi:MAG: DUF4340 domain-containing protein [Treponemataceae bacterium]
MNKKKLLYIHACITFLLFIMLFFGYCIFPQNRMAESQRSALLNHQYLGSIYRIRIVNNNDTLILTKQDGLWFAQQNDVRFLVDEKIVSDFFTIFTQERKLTVISKSLKNIEKYGLQEEKSFFIDIGDEEKSFSQLYFGSENSISYKIFVRTKDNSFIYSTDNNIRQFLTLDKMFWADKNIIPAHEQLTVDKIKRYSITKDNERKTFVRSVTQNKEADDFLYQLLNMRGGEVFSVAVLKNKIRESQIDFESQSKNHKVIFYKNNNDYFVRFDDFDYCLELSAWSYNKLFSFLSKN